MKKKPATSDGVRAPTVKRVSPALNQAAQDAIEVHRRAGLPLVIWQNGKPALVPVKDLPCGESEAS